MYRFREKLAQFMYGRYGTDNLNKFITLVFFILFVVQIFVRSGVLWLVELALLVIFYARTLSRNIYKRQSENNKYLQIKSRIINGRFFRQNQSVGQNVSNHFKYRYLNCPACHQKVRIPRGKGKVEITCPRCRMIFESRS